MLKNKFDFCLTFQLLILNIPNFNQDDLVQAELVLVTIHNINAKQTRPGAFSNAKNLRRSTCIHSEHAKANKMTKPETKDLTKNLEIIKAIIFCHLFWMIGTLDFPNAQSYLSFASTDPPFSGINATKTGITTPLSTLVAAAGKTTTNKKKSSPTSKNFPYLQAHESKQQQDNLNTGQNTGSSIHHGVGPGESKTPQRPIFSPFIQQPGGTFDPKSIDFSALQLPNTPPKTSRNKKHNLHKATSSASSLSSLASSLHSHSQIN